MTTPDEWERWRAVWQEGRAAEPVLDRPIERVQGARRTLALTSAAEAVLVVAALVGLWAALRHAADAIETMLGLSVAAAVVVTWVLHALARRREAGTAAAAASEYVAVVRRLRRRQLRFVRFVWAVLALELVFLTWWWAGGIPVHRSELGAPIAILSLWIPLVAITGFAAWTVRLYRRARHELRQLDRLHDELSAE